MANQGSVSIKIDLDNTDVNKKVSESEKKIEDLGDTAKKSLDGADFNDMAKGASRASGSLDELKQSAQQAQDDIEGLGNGMDRLPEQTKPASQGFTVFKGILADLGSSVIQTVIGKVGSLAGSLFDLIDATSEYSTMQAKLSGSATTFGYSVDYAKGQYQEFYKYLGDDQMATNAITNLLGMKVSTDTVSASASAAIGVWSAYGDSIPIESLTESMNESAQVAQVTGLWPMPSTGPDGLTKIGRQLWQDTQRRRKLLIKRLLMEKHRKMPTALHWRPVPTHRNVRI